MAVYDDLPYLNREMNLIQKAIKMDVPMLGVCLGSQLIAQATGGRVHRGKVKEIGWYAVNISGAGRAGLFAELEDPLPVFQWHGDTYELPKSAQLLASSGLYPQAFRIGSAFGIQFHLEVDEQMIENWIGQYSSEVKSERLDPKRITGNRSSIAQLSASCEQLYRNFLKMLVDAKNESLQNK
jgi:GMP synthase-like glutamine amidotransferase